MTWIIGVVSLALMLAVLSIAPNQLIQISDSIGYQKWQLAGYVLLVIAAGLYLIQRYGYLITRHILTKSHLPYSSKSPSSHLFQHQANLTLRSPINLLREQGLTKLLLALLCACMFWLSVVCHGLAQRIEMLEASPTKTVYIEATVTPIGLSDKRLELGRVNFEGSESDQKPHSKSLKNTPRNKLSELKVEQGYRQLVQLSDIKSYGSELLNKPRLKNNAHGQSGIEGDVEEASRDNPFFEQIESDKANDFEEKTEPLSGVLSDNSAVAKVLLQVYQKDVDWVNNLSPDKSVRLILRLNPIEFKDNLKPQDFDEYRWLSTRHATATANIVSSKSADNNYELQPLTQLTFTQKINQYRFELRQHFLSLIDKRQQKRIAQSNKSKNNQEFQKTTINDSAAVTLSLLTGDRSLISSDMTATYRFVGISHLLAISGTHVLFLAMLCATLATYLINKFAPRLYRLVPRWQCGFVIAVIVAFIYALFAGFDVPAVRTACMLLVVGVLRYLLVPSAVFKVLLALAIAMAWQDIFILWQAGFWLSFIAVASLVVYSRRWGSNQRNRLKKGDLNQHQQANFVDIAKYQVLELLKLQFWISVALLPLSLWLFAEVSLWGFVVNVFAIGFFGWIIVPLNLLAGVVYPVFPWLADKIWQMLFWVLEHFHSLIVWLQATANQFGWLRTEMTVLLMVLLLLMVVPWMLPKGVINRLLSLPSVLLIGVLCLTGWDSQVVDGVDSHDGSQVAITELTTQNPEYSALLIESSGLSDNDSWLLMSAYPKKYQSHQIASQSEQMTELTEHLFKQLDKKGINHLTGVIAQTATPELSKVVANLRQHLPISYYWQAGLTESFDDVTFNLKNSQMTAQHCQAGKSWQGKSQPSDINVVNSTVLKLMAVTGWSVGDDVSDCAIYVNSPNPIAVNYLNKDTQWLSRNTRSTQFASSKQNTAQLNELVNAIAVKDDRHIDDKANLSAMQPLTYSSAVIYTSTQPKVLALWQMLCKSDNAPSSNTLNVQSQHWITSSQVGFDNQTIDDINPVTWHILQGDRGRAPKIGLLETHLYWEQQYKK